MKTEAEVRKALARVEEMQHELAKAGDQPSADQIRYFALEHPRQVLRWVLGENEKNPFANLVDE